MAEKCPKCSGSLFVTPAGNAVCESCSYRRVATQKQFSSNQKNVNKSEAKEVKQEFFRKNQCPKCLGINKFWGREMNDKRKCPACDELFSEEEYELISDGEYSTQTKEEFQKIEEERQRLEVVKQKQEEERQKVEAEKRKQEEQQRKREEEKRNRLACETTTKELSAHSDGGGDYIGLNASLRAQSENLFSRTAKKPVHEWQQEEAELIRLLLDYPKRKECLSLTMDSKEEDNKLILAELKKLNQTMGVLLAAQNETTKATNQNTNITGLGLVAGQMLLADKVAEGIEDAFD